MGFTDGYFDGVRWADMTPNQRRAAFVKENGDYILDSTQVWFIHKNGAICERDILGAYIPAFTENSPNASSMEIKQTLNRKLCYHQTLLGKNIRAFEKLKKELEAQAGDAYVHCAVPPTEKEIDELHRLRAEVKKFEAEVNAIELEINPPKPVVTTPVNLEQREKSKVVLETIKAIEV